MSVTVVTRRRARPGEAPRLIALAVQVLEARVTAAEPLNIARVFQSLSTPADVVFVSNWETREAYWASLQTDHAQEQLDALCVGPPERYFFRRLVFDERTEEPVAVVDCAILQTSPAAVQPLLNDLQQMARPMLDVAPGFLLRYVGQDEDDPTRIILVRGWESLEALEEFRLNVAPPFEAHWFKHGATVERFIGHSRAAVAGSSHPTP